MRNADSSGAGGSVACARLFRNRNSVALWLGQTVSFIGLRTVYVVCGLVIVGAGLLGLFVLQEPAPVESRT